MAKELPSPELMRKLLRYDPKTGRLFWRERGDGMFSKPHLCNLWNSRYAESEAFTSTMLGYRQGSILNRHMLAHRVVWVVYYGRWPEMVLDHINGNRSDNRIDNLREVTYGQNSRNSYLTKSNKTGCPGVFFNKSLGRWQSRIVKNKKATHLGLFNCYTAAMIARRLAEKGDVYSKRNHQKMPSSVRSRYK